MNSDSKTGLNYKQSFVGGVVAFILATSCCWVPWLAIAIGSATGLAGLNAGLEKYSLIFTVVGFIFLGYGSYQFYQKRMKKKKTKDVILLSTITCPECGHEKEEEMPQDACQYFYTCENCKAVLKPVAGDCCVFCSYATVPCPPIQLNEDCC